jgi:hypothetical protein
VVSKLGNFFASLNFKNENFHFLHFFGSHIAKICQKKKSLVVMFYNNKRIVFVVVLPTKCTIDVFLS